MRLIPGALLFTLLGASAALAAPPPPLNSGLYQFPGAVYSPGSTQSGSVAMADAWLADEPFDNPAVPPTRIVSVSPMIYHISRQDLRASNRSLDEQSAYFDGAGSWVGFGKGKWSVFAYAHQPTLRLEDNSYLSGPIGLSPAPTENSVSTREFHGGAGLSRAFGRLRLGAAAEYTKRQDSYSNTDRSGSPVSGTTDVSFSGDAVGGVAGLRLELGPEKGVGQFMAGASVRYLPELKVSGDQSTDLVTLTSTSSVSATRKSGYEGGVSLRYVATSQVRVVGGAGGRTSQEWSGFDVTRGAGFRWGLGVDFHDVRDPWTLRFGLGQESDPGSPEPRSGVVGIGIGWKLDTTQLDFGLVQHNFKHNGSASCYDDRVLITAVIPF